MEYVLITLKAIAAYFVLLIVGTNLIGVVIRGFIVADTSNSNELAREAYGKAGHTTTLIFVFLLIGYLYALYHFFNIWVLIAAVILIVGRIPDLLWEIRNGKKITLRNMPKNFSGQFLNILGWGVFPLLWYAFYIT